MLVNQRRLNSFAAAHRLTLIKPTLLKRDDQRMFQPVQCIPGRVKDGYSVDLWFEDSVNTRNLVRDVHGLYWKGHALR
jgi:hypothetical protein